jgi:CelD/BcsL family acetyltransferase involved in cellulose biosynthesis
MYGRFSSQLSQSGTVLLRLTSLEDMAVAQTLWRALDARSQARHVWFQSFEWCYQWLRHHGDARCTPLIFMLVRDGAAVAVLPLMRTKKRVGITSLRMLGAPHTQYANVLTANGQLSAREHDTLRNALMHEPGIDQLLFDLVPQGSPLVDLLPRGGRLVHLDNQSSQLDLAQFETVAAYEQSLGKKSSRNLRRAISQFEQAGALTFEVMRPATAGYLDLVTRCLKMKASWLAATGRISQGLEQGDHGAFLAALQTSHGGEGPIAFALRLNGKPIAIELGYLQRGHYYAYMGAFDWAWRNLSPGKLQMHKSICWLIENGADRLDLLGNPSDYKQHYASQTLPMHGFVVNRSWRGRAYTTLWTRNTKPRLKALFHHMPEHWRTSLHVMRKIEYNFVA